MNEIKDLTKSIGHINEKPRTDPPVIERAAIPLLLNKLDKLNKKLDKCEKIFLDLKSLDHHSIKEEMWRIDEGLEVFREKKDG